ncbi:MULTISPECIES: tol-pal system protein YbgF [Rhodopseudomonas]|uniref:Cell division coordinator CpoB n=1 Tax=Rhodopseudomonas palustris TaxID=1076 RepID=A0A0D7EUN1_RHOPL|nr:MULTISPECIES: tol-pal system protein YbgF [Rhodopseudomonas]KIZ44346.1 tol-pal system protein [Rhodopseudomonas palustris]MDF3811466.1 tol-pal system protein YbgF [Rhodopseudomonas sp. BAL398]WOK17398.1 tol-pal system protein YbgF [Rhodopseudomonas sp. BAL398]
MSPSFPVLARAFAVVAMLAFVAPALAQSDGEMDPELRVQQLESQLRELTGQNEELQYRNRRLEEQLKLLQGNAPGATPPAGAQPGVAAAPVGQPQQALPPVYGQQPVQAPMVQEQAPPASTGRRGDAFDPSQNPTAPGVPRPLGGGQLPIPGTAGGRDPGQPLDLSNTASPAYGAPSAPVRKPGPGALTTAPPSQSPRDEFDLGIGYMQRKDYALAEETMRNFIKKYPSDPLTADSQYWLGESFFQRQMYRDAAESFLAVTTKYDTSTKAPDALLRLGQSLAALKEKEAACAAFGEVGRKYPHASKGVKRAVDREQKRVKC